MSIARRGPPREASSDVLKVQVTLLEPGVASSSTSAKT
jgi:hypothetical protein